MLPEKTRKRVIFGAFNDSAAGYAKPALIGVAGTTETEVALQTLDDGYAGLQFLDSNGYRIGTMNFDRADQQWELYDAKTDMGNLTSDEQPGKVMNVGAIGPHANWDRYRAYIDTIDAQDSAGNDISTPTAELLLVRNTQTGQNLLEKWQENGADQYARVYDAGDGRLRYLDYTNVEYYLDIDPSTRTVEVHGDWAVTSPMARGDVATTSYTAAPGESLWVDTNAAGGAVTVTLPADDDTDDGDRVEVGVEDGTNDTTISPNTGQSILGVPTTLQNAGETIMLEYKSSTSTWMIRS